MKKVNKILKERLTDKLSLKSRYKNGRYKRYRKFHMIKYHYDLDKTSYCIYNWFIDTYEFYSYKEGIKFCEQKKVPNSYSF